MFGIDDIRKAKDVFSWVLKLGGDDTEKIRNELNDLLFHASTTLKTILEIVELIEDFDDDVFDPDEFKELYRVCRRFYLCPEALDKCRTHCSDLFRDVNRIEFRLAKYGRTKDVGISHLNGLISDVKAAEDDYLESFDSNVEFLQESLKNIEAYLVKNDKDNAIKSFGALKSKMLEDLDVLHGAKKEMAIAENHIRQVLT